MQNPKWKGLDGVEPCGTALLSLTSWWGSRVGTRADVLGGWRLPGLQQLCPCSWGPIMHMGLLLPRAVSLVLTLQSVAQGGRNSLEESLPLLKQCKSWRFWGLCFAGDGRRGLFRCKGSNWSSITTLFIVMPEWELYGGHNILKSILRQMLAVAYIHVFWTQERNLFACV